MLPPLWRRLRRSNRVQTVQRKRTTRSNRIRLSLEALETRDLLSGCATPFYELFQPQNGAVPMGTTGPTGYTPSQTSQAYGFDQIPQVNGQTLNGAGQTIAIVDAYNDPNIIGDLQAFDKQFNLPNPNMSVLNQNGGTTLPANDTTGWALEESLDVEWAHAMAPGANIVLIEANSNYFSDLFAAVQTAAALPQVVAVSMSWGGGEWSSESGSDSVFTPPASNPGVVFIASSGDSGAPPTYPAVSPNVLAVGGTTLNLTDNAGDYGSESAWSGSGGGISAYEPLPRYQPNGYTNGTKSGTSTMRMNPDVAYDADPYTGFPVYDSYNEGTSAPWIQVGGTSDAAPQWAALVALTDQGRQLADESALSDPSQLLPTLYRIPSDFHDITTGTTDGSPNYTAGPGYDLTTGMGTPIANNLVPDLIYGAAPAPPTGLTATATSSSQINLSWNSSTDAHTYTLERSLDDTNWTLLTTLTGTIYSDSGLQPSTTYYYRVLATNGFGSSADSAPVSATTQGGTSGSATFLKTDTTTQGNWQGVYGSNGYNIIDNAVNYPSYAQVSASGNSTWLWANPTSDPRALQEVGSSNRIAACWYSGSSFTVNVDITDGQTHQLALYLLDWDFGGARAEQVQILDATTGKVLNTENASNFQNGEYLVWNVGGDINIVFTNTGTPNAVLSGMFFDAAGSPPPFSGGSAGFVKTDTTTQGNWQGVYGSNGYNVIENAVNYPSYAQISASGNNNYIWTTSSTDPQALEEVGSSNRIAACWYSGISFMVNVDITDGQTHQLALYLLDWDQWGGGRDEQIQILDAKTGNILSTEWASNFSNGEYLVWNVGGNIEIKITNLNSASNAVLNGLFFDPVGTSPSPGGSASFVKTDTTTQGNWQGVYGSQGYNVIDNAVNYPSYAQVSASGNSTWLWANPTSDPRALQEVGSSNRIAACWYSGSSFTVNVDITDGQTHQLALYLVDWDFGGARAEQVQILDATTGKVLSTENASNFQNGEYLVWNVGGDINIVFTNTGTPNAVLSGMFFDAAGSPPPSSGGSASFVKTDTTTQGNWQKVYGSNGFNVIDDAVSYPSHAQISSSGNSNWIWTNSTFTARNRRPIWSMASIWFGTSVATSRSRSPLHPGNADVLAGP